MRATKKLKRLLVGLLLMLIATAAISTIPVYAAPTDTLYLGGFTAGFMLNTQHVEVIGLCEITTESGPVCPAKEAGIKSGDIIYALNGIKITSSGQLNKQLNEDYKKFTFTVLRGNERLEIDIVPVKDQKSGKNKVGMLIRDSLTGIGTVTYIDKESSVFASLGHPVSDSQGNLIEINGGTLYGCTVYDVIKGVRGTPGELKGIFDNKSMLGVITKNCESGIYGQLSSEFDYTNLNKVQKGSVEDAVMGKAFIYSTLDGEGAKEYEISIVKIDESNSENKNYVIKVNDKSLLEKSGGIVQGMSGSPIVQDGKLIGAVTHVFVNDPTRGYGISLDNMLANCP